MKMIDDVIIIGIDSGYGNNKQRICPYRFRLSGAMPLKPQQKG